MNGGSTSSPEGLLTSWLGQQNGSWSATFGGCMNYGDAKYWLSTTYPFNSAYALYFSGASVNPAASNTRDIGAAVRCLGA